MAITLVTNDVDRCGFFSNGNSADLSGCETLVAAVAGKSIYVERVAVSFGAAISVTLGAGETTGAVTTVLVGPLYGAANTTVELVFTRPIKLAAATALVADSSGAGNVTITCQGYVK
jgi:hypothetical protein